MRPMATGSASAVTAGRPAGPGRADRQGALVAPAVGTAGRGQGHRHPARAGRVVGRRSGHRAPAAGLQGVLAVPEHALGVGAVEREPGEELGRHAAPRQAS